MSSSGEKIVSRKQRLKNIPASQTNSAHKHSQLGSQITEPISAWKVYFRWLPGEISPCNLQSTLSVSHCALKNIFGCLFFFFLKLLEQNAERPPGQKVKRERPLESKLKRLGGKIKFSTKKTKRQLQMNR